MTNNNNCNDNDDDYFIPIFKTVCFTMDSVVRYLASCFRLDNFFLLNHEVFAYLSSFFFLPNYTEENKLYDYIVRKGARAHGSVAD